MHRPVIAPATADDAAAVVALWHACGLTRPWNDPHADFARAQGGGSSDILVARDGDVIGSVMVGHDGHRGWLYYLAVVPDAQGQGIGSALFAAAEDWLRTAGVPKVQLMVRSDNHAAMAFYAACGLDRQDVAVFGRFLTG
ncbi:GNAT family acetyltransferase [Sphingomonas hankookensis]|uniref:GNAT family acetyltransferase n=1 Tax=Sphingomonas hankookensis TaxID=563996 RepID=UPI001F57EEB2